MSCSAHFEQTGHLLSLLVHALQHAEGVSATNTSGTKALAHSCLVLPGPLALAEATLRSISTHAHLACSQQIVLDETRPCTAGPIYTSSIYGNNFKSDVNVAEDLQNSLEEVFYQYQVDMTLGRPCPPLRGTDTLHEHIDITINNRTNCSSIALQQVSLCEECMHLSLLTSR